MSCCFGILIDMFWSIHNHIIFYILHSALSECILSYFLYSDNSLIRVDRLEYHIREELNKTAPRSMVVLRPLKVWCSVPVLDYVVPLWSIIVHCATFFNFRL